MWERPDSVATAVLTPHQTDSLHSVCCSLWVLLEATRYKQPISKQLEVVSTNERSIYIYCNIFLIWGIEVNICSFYWYDTLIQLSVWVAWSGHCEAVQPPKINWRSKTFECSCLDCKMYAPPTLYSVPCMFFLYLSACTSLDLQKSIGAQKD